MFFSSLIWSSLLFASFGGSAHALAAAKYHEPSHTLANSLNTLAGFMPQSSLAAPTGQLKHVVLGLGTQNYTCANGGELGAPSTTGATAVLYDIGSKLSTNLPAAKWKLPAIAALALLLSTHPQALNSYLKLEGFDRVVGHHFFGISNGKSLPIFAFDQLSESPYPIAQVKKVEETDAPRSAYPGLQQEGAVPWLHLTNAGSSVGGVDTVYRLETAGGKGPVDCQGLQGSFEVNYAAQYWVFGPSETSRN
ncbi:hypothetical protein J3E72DRAFT_380154 [Bipolaris maydis]|nr:hypothetical protein J3E72DRAFT_380842 [Bipolaris maydis]KAJ6192063.1 hypothetical protein J3E72DRAFT_380154 [Bipolaris maydis]